MKPKPSHFLVFMIFLAAGCNRNLVSVYNRGTFPDPRDNREYTWVRLRNQTWMAENLAYLPQVSPAQKGSVFIPQYYVYDYQGNDVFAAQMELNYSRYGVLYNWTAAGHACPAGWHLPKDKEWRTLEKNLGMKPYDLEFTGWRESGSVGRLILADSLPDKGWTIRRGKGFQVVLAGYRTPATGFQYLGSSAVFWTATAGGPDISWSRTVDRKQSGVSRITDDRSHGFSVRCVKDSNRK
jgi:uncharacterized protein (TIGR02145 family)